MDEKMETPIKETITSYDWYDDKGELVIENGVALRDIREGEPLKPRKKQEAEKKDE